MHWNIEQILWTLVLTAHLILLIVLLGRDRVGRFPWFTSAIGLSAVCLLADHLLHGKLTTLAFYWQNYTGIALQDILGLAVLLELVRDVFLSRRTGLIVKPAGWIGWTLFLVAINAAAIWYFGPWPSWQALHADPKQLPLLFVVLFAMKGQLCIALFAIEAALLLRIFGKRFGFGWRSHAQQIALGLSTYAVGFLAVQVITESIKRTVHLTSREQYERIVHLFTNLDNARFALWFLVLIWWIIWLWRDEPAAPSAAVLAEAEPVLAGPPPPLEADIPEASQQSDPDARD
jgi:hypothetical protein